MSSVYVKVDIMVIALRSCQKADRLLDSILGLLAERITAFACGDKKIKGKILYTITPITHCDHFATFAERGKKQMKRKEAASQMLKDILRD